MLLSVTKNCCFNSPIVSLLTVIGLQIDIPKYHWSEGLYFERSLFWKVIDPKGNFLEGVITPIGLISDRLLSRTAIDPKAHYLCYSEKSFRQVFIRKIVYPNKIADKDKLVFQT